MTREDRLYAMTGATLIQVADKLGVKVYCNKTRTALKEAKANVIERILAAEKAAEEAETAEIMQAKIDAGVEIAEINPEEVQIVDEIQPEEVVEVKTKKQKKERKTVLNTARLTEEVIEVLTDNNIKFRVIGKRVRFLDSDNKCFAFVIPNKNDIRLYIMSDAVKTDVEKYEENKNKKSRYTKTNKYTLDEFTEFVETL